MNMLPFARKQPGGTHLGEFKFIVLIGASILGVDPCGAQIEAELIGINAVWKYDDSGVDLGAEWKEAGFDDSGWASGPAPLGYPLNEVLPLTTMQTELVLREPLAVTTYYRTHFTFDQNLAGVRLVSSNLIDDGAVFYLNGEEVGRIAMPQGVVGYDTPAARASDIGGERIDVLELAASSLVEGDNVLAAELHQGGAFSSDAVFACSLWFEGPTPGPAIITEHPVDQQSVLGETVTFDVVVDGSPPYSLQWFKDGQAIMGETNFSLTLSDVTLQDVGAYFVTVSNALGGAASSVAMLTLIEGTFTLLNFNYSWRYDASGTDHGTVWREPGFDDSSWPSGPGPLGFPENEPLPELLETILPRVDGLTTYYFRTDFNFMAEPAGYELVFDAEIDDGAVFYLNGAEVLRVGMSAGPVVFGTRSQRSIGDAGLEVFRISAEFLRPGANLLAVEIHQASLLSSDMVFGLRMIAELLPPTMIRITRQPEDLTVDESREVRMSIEFEGAPARLLWFKDGVAIPGANQKEFVLANAMEADSGVYHVVVSNALNVVTSDSVALTVLPDVTPPSVVSADGTESVSIVVVAFSEAVLAEGATNVSHYLVTNRLGGSVAVLSATLTDLTNVVLVTEPRVGEEYLVSVSGVRDQSPSANVILPHSRAPVTSRLMLVEWESEWVFADPFPGLDELDLGTAWREEDYPPVSEWGIGQAAFEYGTGGRFIPVSVGFSLSGGAPTTYFRQWFAFQGSPLGATVRLRHVVEDGAVFYLNGAELLRYNMPTGEVSYLTAATSSVPVLAVSESVPLPVEMLRQGDNLLAVEVHPAAQNKLFACELAVDVASRGIGPVVITTPPRDLTVGEGEIAELTFMGAGPLWFQWHRDGVPIVDATNAVYRRRAGLVDDGALFHVVAWNESSGATSGVARVTVVGDTTPPVLVSVIGLGSTLTVVFSEPVDALGASDPANYSLRSASNEAKSVIGAELIDDVTVRLRIASPAALRDVLLVRGITDRSESRNPIEPSRGRTVGFDGVLVRMEDVWSYDDSGQDFGTAWRELPYNDEAWASGPALLGFDSAGLTEPIRTEIVPPSAGGTVITHFRRRFFSPRAGTLPVRLRYFVDDGAVFFVNGQEVRGVRVAGGPTFYYSSGSVGNAVSEGPFELLLTNLAVGENLLAVELFQSSELSSDLVFGAELLMDAVPSDVPPAPPMLLMERQATTVVLSWNTPGFVLEQGGTVTGPWLPLQGAVSPVTRPLFGRARYFRLREVQP